jgi:tRNA (adenine57-N1/adenine58-N1)-methyltransferase
MSLYVAGGRFVSFSPCIEQVQRTCEALKQHGFMELATMECLQKELQVQKRVMPVLDLPQPKVSHNALCIMLC